MKTDKRGIRYQDRFSIIDGKTVVLCSICKQNLPPESFCLQKAKGKLHSRCNQCKRDYANSRYVKKGWDEANALKRQRMIERRFKNGFWLCTRCKVHKDESHFLRNGQSIDSWCRECKTKHHAQKQGKKQKELSVDRMNKRFEERLNTLKECPRCGQSKPISKWPRESGSYKGQRAIGRLLKHCCSSNNRTREDVEKDIAAGSKVCKACGIRKPFSSYSPHRDRKDGRQTVCRSCRSAKVHSGEWNGNSRRQALIDERTDGTITTEHIRKIFAVKICPCCDGYMKRDDKVLDHIVPLKLGGLHSAKNVTVMCWSCNSSKSAIHPSKWLQLLVDEAADRMRAHYESMGLNFDE